MGQIFYPKRYRNVDRGGRLWNGKPQTVNEHERSVYKIWLVFNTGDKEVWDKEAEAGILGCYKA